MMDLTVVMSSVATFSIPGLVTPTVEAGEIVVDFSFGSQIKL